MSDQKPTGHPTVIDIYVDDKDTLDALAEALGATPPQLLNAMIGAAA